MWLFTKDAFLSIVQDGRHPDRLWVRARIKGDIERLFPKAQVEQTENRDYLYRASIPKAAVADVMWSQITAIDYGNFKAAVPDRVRHDPYLTIWETMADLQDRLRSAA